MNLYAPPCETIGSKSIQVDDKVGGVIPSEASAVFLNRSSQFFKAPLDGSILYLYILRVPHGMDGVTDGGEYDPALPEIVSPS